MQREQGMIFFCVCGRYGSLVHSLLFKKIISVKRIADKILSGDYADEDPSVVNNGDKVLCLAQLDKIIEL